MDLSIPVILGQNHIAVRQFPSEIPKMLHIFGGTVVLSAADSNKSIAGGNRSYTKNPFPTLAHLPIPIYRAVYGGFSGGMNIIHKKKLWALGILYVYFT
jgi:hypothetical protein